MTFNLIDNSYNYWYPTIDVLDLGLIDDNDLNNINKDLKQCESVEFKDLKELRKNINKIVREYFSISYKDLLFNLRLIVK